MYPAERELLREFLEHGSFLTRTPEIEVPLTYQIKDLATESAIAAQAWANRTALKADAIIHDWYSVDLIEVKQDLTPEAIGQAICYRFLWNKLNPEKPIHNTIIICMNDRPELHEILAENRITLHIPYRKEN